MNRVTVVTGSPEETRDLGERLGRALSPGTVIALVGELGSGKTVFAQGLARGLGTEEGVLVTSPSFVILHEYPPSSLRSRALRPRGASGSNDGRLPLYHFDFYRLQSAREVRDLGYEEYFEGNGVCAVEWGDKFPELFGPAAIWIDFERVDEQSRRIEIKSEEPLAMEVARPA